jgi:hypothetical protein
MDGMAWTMVTFAPHVLANSAAYFSSRQLCSLRSTAQTRLRIEMSRKSGSAGARRGAPFERQAPSTGEQMCDALSRNTARAAVEAFTSITAWLAAFGISAATPDCSGQVGMADSDSTAVAFRRRSVALLGYYTSARRRLTGGMDCGGQETMLASTCDHLVQLCKG